MICFLHAENPFRSHLKSLQVGDQEFKYYDVRSLGGEKFGEWTMSYYRVGVSNSRDNCVVYSCMGDCVI